MIWRLAMLLLVLATPAWADIPGIDATLLDERRDRGDRTTAIDNFDRNRRTANQRVTCALYRPGRRDNVIAAANANPSTVDMVRRIAREEGIDEHQFLALVYQESRFNPCAKSGAGAIGLAQLMPGTASELGVDPNNIEQNVRGGARYFKQQLRRYGGNVSLALAAYNSGSGNVERHGGIPPFRETQDYVRNITGKWLPAFGGADKSGVAQNYAGTSAAYEHMRSSTLNAMGLTSARNEETGDVASWFAQLGSVRTVTIQDSWDHNSRARNGNVDMLNRMLALSTSFADLVNSANTVTLSDISGASHSGRYHAPADTKVRNASGFCDEHLGLVWDSVAKGCVRTITQNDRLLFVPQ